MAAVMTDSSPSVLVIRLDAIGDALALTPLLAGLAGRGIPVDVVLRAGNAAVFSSRAARARFVAPFALRSSTRSNLRAIREFGHELRAGDYTHVLVATEDPGGYRLARAIGAPARIGFINGWGKPFKTLWAASMLTRRIVRSAGLDPKAPHECEVLWKLGIPLIGDAPIPRDTQTLRPLVIERDLGRGETIAFQVSDKWERLGIAFDEVVRAVRLLAGAFTLHAIASEAEHVYAERIAAAAAVPVERFASLEPWKEAIASARAIAAPDSGAIHVAGMTGTPVVAVFPPITEFALQSSRWRPWAAPSRLVLATPGWPEELVPAMESLLHETTPA
jgi:ADP-heptose:LPS heptosyltransferase